MDDALVMSPFEEQKSEQDNFDNIAMNEVISKKKSLMIKQLRMFSLQNHTSSSLLLVQDVPRQHILSSLASCSETICTLVMQLDAHLLYPGGAPILPYCKDCKGHGPAWEHSLFEDNAEFAYGFYLAQDAIRKELLIRLENLKNAGSEPAVIGEYMEHWNDSEKSREVTDNLVKALEQLPVNEDIQYILTNKEYLAKKSVWQ